MSQPIKNLVYYTCNIFKHNAKIILIIILQLSVELCFDSLNGATTSK